MAPAQAAAADGARLSFVSRHLAVEAASQAENRHGIEHNSNWIEGPAMGSEGAAVT
jgi:hypothetical protein